MYLNGIKGILSKRDRELIERDTYNRNEFSRDYYNEWSKGSDLVDEIFTEGELLAGGYSLEYFRDEE